MIGPDTYKGMLDRKARIRVANPGMTSVACAMMPDAHDRLEAALDTALVESIRSRHCAAVTANGSNVRVIVELRRIRHWLGDVHHGKYGEWKPEWTKCDIASLFNYRDGVGNRYLVGGWAKCECWWESRQARNIIFSFLTPAGVAVEDAREARRKADEQDKALGVRAMRAMIELGDVLGVEREGWMGMHISGIAEDTVSHLEDLRLAARLMRFDLEATRREGAAGGDSEDAGQFEEFPDPDGYFPPFEGSPDDESFGNEPDAD